MALITGGAGFIGSHLSEALLERGYRVTAVDNLSTGRFENIVHLVKHPRFSFVIDTITNEVVMDRLVSECDLVFHLAAAVGVDLIVRDPVHVIETNVLSTHTLLRIAARYRKKVLIASTSEIYGKNVKVPFREDDDRLLGPTTKSRWSYATSKAVDEFLGLAYHHQKDLPVVIFRLFNTVGPRQTGQYGMVVPRFVGQALKGEDITVYGDGEQSRCFCDVRDSVRALVGLSESPQAIGQVFNVGATEEITIRALAERVLHLVSARSPGARVSTLRNVPYEEAYTAGFEDMRRRVPDISKINGLLGWSPRRSLDDTLLSIVECMTSQEAVVVP
jgi:UDP-glucose 4-epimerase